MCSLEVSSSYLASISRECGKVMARSNLDYGGYDMDLTLVVMQQLIRVTYFAWAVNDSVIDREKLPAEARERVIQKNPSLLDFLSYNFNFLGMLCPSVDFFDYMEFIKQKRNYSEIPIKINDHLIVARNCLGAIVFYVLCTSFLYTPDDCLTDKVRNQVNWHEIEHFCQIRHLHHLVNLLQVKVLRSLDD